MCYGEGLDLALTCQAVSADQARLCAEDAAVGGCDLQLASSFHLLAIFIDYKVKCITAIRLRRPFDLIYRQEK